MVEMTLRGNSQQARRGAGLTATEPSSLFAIKSLLYPLSALLTLLACIVIWHGRFYGTNFLFATLSFVVVANVLGVARLQLAPDDPYCLRCLRHILQRWILVLGFMAALLYLSRLTRSIDLDLYFAWAAVTPLVLWLAHLATQRLLMHGNDRQTRPRKAVIIGLTELGLRLERQLKSEPLLGTEVLGFLEDRHADRLPAEGVARVLGKPASLPEMVGLRDISVVYVTLPMTQHPRILSLLDGLGDSTVSIYFVPDLVTFDLIQARFDVIGGLPVVAVRESPFYGGRGIAKRLSDMAIAGALVLLLSPLLLLVGLGVRLTSPGPVIFKQRRYGLDGREILIYKFRSMSVTEDGATQYTQVTRTDSRVTPFGAFIRRMSLDELPQLFNVLEGSLSLVGPRPHAIAVNEQYRKLIPGYMVRHKIKPGITGWAQINGCRGGDDLESMTKRVEFDLDYLRHWSLMLDLTIIARTAATVWNDRRAY